MCTIRKDVSKEKDSAQYVTSFEVNPSRVFSLPLRVRGWEALRAAPYWLCRKNLLGEKCRIRKRMRVSGPDIVHSLVYQLFSLKKKNLIKIYNNEIENGSEIIRSIMHQLFLWILHFNSVGRLVLGAIPKATIYITGIELMKWPLKGWEGGKKKKVGDHVKNGACVGLLAGWIIDRHILDAHNASFAPSPTYSTHRNDGTHSQRTR